MLIFTSVINKIVHVLHTTLYAILSSCNLKCIIIIKFDNKIADIPDVIVSNPVVHGLRYANCVPFLVIVK